MTEIKTCLFCSKLLESAVPDELGYQPYGGGEVQFLFSYGSTKFDNKMEGTVFRGLICDECAEPYVPKMEEMQ